jgi:hypothetical protein
LDLSLVLPLPFPPSFRGRWCGRLFLGISLDCELPFLGLGFVHSPSSLARSSSLLRSSFLDSGILTGFGTCTRHMLT